MIFIPIAVLKSIVSCDVGGAISGHFYWYFSEVFIPVLNTVNATDNGQIMRSIKAGVYALAIAQNFVVLLYFFVVDLDAFA